MNDNKWVTHWCINQWAPITQSRSCTHKDTIIAVQYSWHGVHNYNVAVMWVETYASKHNLKSTSKSSFKVTNQVATFDKMCIFWLANSFIYLIFGNKTHWSLHITNKGNMVMSDSRHHLWLLFFSTMYKLSYLTT